MQSYFICKQVGYTVWQSGRVSMHSGRVSIHSGRVSVHSGRVSIHSGRVSIHSGRVSIHSGRVSIHSREGLAYTPGGLVYIQAAQYPCTQWIRKELRAETSRNSHEPRGICQKTQEIGYVWHFYYLWHLHATVADISLCLSWFYIFCQCSQYLVKVPEIIPWLHII